MTERDAILGRMQHTRQTHIAPHEQRQRGGGGGNLVKKVFGFYIENFVPCSKWPQKHFGVAKCVSEVILPSFWGVVCIDFRCKSAILIPPKYLILLVLGNWGVCKMTLPVPETL